MTFQQLDSLIAASGRRSLASSLVAHIIDAMDQNLVGLDLDEFQKDTQYIRNNITAVASYLHAHGIIDVLYFRDGEGERSYDHENKYGRWAKQHYRVTETVRRLYRRD